jgi:hypothetical protein
VKRKVDALKFAHGKLTEVEPELTLDHFISHTPRAIIGQFFGAPGEDFYLTTLLSTVARDRPRFDPVAAAVLNRIVLQLNFQTRFLGSRGQPESFVLDGGEDLFAPAMANANVVLGICTGEDPNKGLLPEWAKCSHVEFLQHTSLWRSMDQASPVMQALGRGRIGCLALILPLPGAGPNIETSKRYSDLEKGFSDDSFFVLSAPVETALSAMTMIEEAEPEAHIISRVYVTDAGEHRAVVIASGLAAIPALNLENSVEMLCELSSSQPRIAAGELGYANLTYADGHEMVKIKPPIAILASTPLPEEARRRVSADQLFPHLAYSFRNGAIAPSTDAHHSTYVHFDGNGRIIDDVGEGPNLVNTPMVRESVVDRDGVRRALFKAERRLKVSGAAMPLAFTPSLVNYHSHFLIQCFPRILILRDLGIDASILVPPNLRRKQREMLHMAGIADERIVVIPENALVQADELIVPYCWPLVFSPYTLRIYDEMASKVPRESSRPRRRLLISREQRTTWRNMLTYDAVRQMLVDRYNFEVIRPELLSLEEEILTYGDAEIMIGAEGAGLYSAVYAGPGQTFMAIGDEDYIMPTLGSAANVRGFDVAYAFGESFRADSDVERRLAQGHSDFVIDPELVASLIERVLAVQQNR